MERIEKTPAERLHALALSWGIRVFEDPQRPGVALVEFPTAFEVMGREDDAIRPVQSSEETETAKISSERFKAWLANVYHMETRGKIITDRDLRETVRLLIGQALYQRANR